MRALEEMTIVARRDEVLSTLHKNREKHAKIVVEAREGYIEQAKKALVKRLDQLKEGKLVSIHFSLNVPMDQTKAYDIAIKMLEMHQGDTIELSARQVQNLVNDDWEWMDHFLGANAAYSGTARGMMSPDSD